MSFLSWESIKKVVVQCARLAPQDPKDRAAVWGRFRAALSVLFCRKPGELADRWAKAEVSEREAKAEQARAETEKVLVEVQRLRGEVRQVKAKAQQDEADAGVAKAKAETAIEQERLRQKALSYIAMSLSDPGEVAETLRAIITRIELASGRVEIPPPDEDKARALPDESRPGP